MEKDLRKELLASHDNEKIETKYTSAGGAKRGEDDFFIDPRYIQHETLKEAIEIDRDFWPQYQQGSQEQLSPSTAIGPDYQGSHSARQSHQFDLASHSSYAQSMQTFRSGLQHRQVTTKKQYIYLLTTKFDEQRQWLLAKCSAVFPMEGQGE